MSFKSWFENRESRSLIWKVAASSKYNLLTAQYGLIVLNYTPVSYQFFSVWSQNVQMLFCLFLLTIVNMTVKSVSGFVVRLDKTENWIM